MGIQDSVDFCTADITSYYSEIDPEVEGAVDRISSIEKHQNRVFGETLSDYGLNHGEYRMLLRLVTRSAEHRLSAGELSRILSLSSGAMTNRIDRLEKSGLIRRVPDPRDRRGVLVELTAEGKRRIDAAVTEQAAKEIDAFSALTAKELKQLNMLLRKVLIAIEGPAEETTAAAS